MTLKLYWTPDSYSRTDKSRPVGIDIADFLLNFDVLENVGCPLKKIVTVPSLTDSGFIIRACQLFYGGWRTFVYSPEENEMYEFKEALVTLGKNRGLFGHLPPREEKRLAYSTSKDLEKFKSLEVNEVPDKIWFHFNGTPEKLIEILKRKCSSPTDLFSQKFSQRR